MWPRISGSCQRGRKSKSEGSPLLFGALGHEMVGAAGAKGRAFAHPPAKAKAKAPGSHPGLCIFEICVGLVARRDRARPVPAQVEAGFQDALALLNVDRVEQCACAGEE